MQEIYKNNLQYSDKLLKNSFTLLYDYNKLYMIAHIAIAIESLILKVYLLFFLNIISVLWFIYNGYKMKKTPLEKYPIAEIRITIEIILHQLISFFIVGHNCGFQFILLASSCTLFTLYKNNNSKITYIIKAATTVSLFLILQFCGKNWPSYYKIKEPIASIWGASMIITVFVLSAFFTAKSYKNLMASMENFKSESIKHYEKTQEIQREVISSLANIIESRDGSTGEHTKRTANYIENLLNVIKDKDEYKDVLTEDLINNIRLAAPLHDIGKIKIPDSILQKPGKLTDEEFSEIKKHPVYGSEIIAQTISGIEDEEYVKVANNMAKYHHERWDGKGYPEGLSGDNIPFEARIMAIADVYDALINKRCYKDAFSVEKSLNIIKEGSGTQFDAKLATDFINMIQNESA